MPVRSGCPLGDKKFPIRVFMRKIKLRQSNPIIVLLLVLITFGIYLLYWGKYLANTLNQIAKSEIVKISILEKIFTIILATYLLIFGFLMLIGPLSFNSVYEGTTTILSIIFYIGFMLALLWTVGIISYFCFINLKIDSMLKASNDKLYSPYLSIFITIIFFFLFFLFVPFTQYKMNQLIKVSSMKNEIIIT
jgi:hypothetical protein